MSTWTSDRPRYRLFDAPSPLHRLERFSAAVGGGVDVWIKREDLLPLAFGGNKLRNLEFLVGAALAEDADTLVTVGRRWSNHCRLTAAAGATRRSGCPPGPVRTADGPAQPGHRPRRAARGDRPPGSHRRPRRARHAPGRGHRRPPSRRSHALRHRRRGERRGRGDRPGPRRARARRAGDGGRHPPSPDRRPVRDRGDAGWSARRVRPRGAGDRRDRGHRGSPGRRDPAGDRGDRGRPRGDRRGRRAAVRHRT